jgi:hypothetical protein
LNILDRITERTGARPAVVVDVSLRLRIRELAERFALEVIGALRSTTLREVSEALADHGARGRGTRAPSPANAGRASRGQPVTHGRRPALGLAQGGSGPSLLQAEMPERSSLRPGARSPFDITMPGELLDAVESDSEHLRMVRSGASSPVSGHRVRQAPKSSLLSDQKSVDPAPPTTLEPTAEAATPTVALRAGERVLRATGSGVVIRRVRPV